MRRSFEIESRDKYKSLRAEVAQRESVMAVRFASGGMAFRSLYRNLSSYHSEMPFRKSHAQELIIKLRPTERQMLLKELIACQEAEISSRNQTTPGVSTRPTNVELRSVALVNAMPFIGFGFLDNFIMIVAGDYIDLTLGTTLCISTMAAAALGNLISDVAGIGSAWYVETLSGKFGVVAPVLTPEQINMSSTRWFSNLGKAIGVSIGCLLGMVPLLFLPVHKKKSDRPKDGTEKPSE